MFWPEHSPSHLCSPINNVLNLNITPHKHYHTVFNAAGRIASTNIHNTDFDHGGIQHLTFGASFAIFHSFDTGAQAFAHICHFYPHIHQKSDLDHMNANCCHDTSNLNNPSPAIALFISPTLLRPPNTNNAFISPNSNHQPRPPAWPLLHATLPKALS
jgi:hypothetical protein